MKILKRFRNLREIELDALLFSKIQTKEDVLEAEKLLNEVNPNLSLMIMIETPLSVLNIQEICAASSKVEVVVVGSNKLMNRLHIDIKKVQKLCLTTYRKLHLLQKRMVKL